MGEHDVPVDTVCDELPLFALPTLSTSGATTFRSPRVVGTALLSSLSSAVDEKRRETERHPTKVKRNPLFPPFTLVATRSLRALTS